MVKRAIAILLGAVAGILLWYVFDWWRTPAEVEAVPLSVADCVQHAMVDCVDAEGFVPAPPAAGSVAQPCKDWLSEDLGAAALSACLQEARRGRDAVRLENFKRAQRIAASS